MEIIEDINGEQGSQNTDENQRGKRNRGDVLDKEKDKANENGQKIRIISSAEKNQLMGMLVGDDGDGGGNGSQEDNIVTGEFQEKSQDSNGQGSQQAGEESFMP